MPTTRRAVLASAALLLCALMPAAHAVDGAAAELIGHWRYTFTGFDTVTDTHLLLHPDGRVESWRVTPEGRSGVETGRWQAAGRQLTVFDDVGQGGSKPYTIHEGRLVLPNIPNQRKFWERVR